MCFHVALCLSSPSFVWKMYPHPGAGQAREGSCATSRLFEESDTSGEESACGEVGHKGPETL